MTRDRDWLAKRLDGVGVYTTTATLVARRCLSNGDRGQIYSSHPLFYSDSNTNEI